LDVPGAGLCIPDLVFKERGTGARVYFEVLGYWSRDAVWRRVELVQAGLREPVLFAVSSRLRVSEEVLSDDDSAALYVYKGALSARAVLRKLEALQNRAPRR
jgi:predicted nuclease of restriction endonuclease-like RecB superfamily